MKSPLWGCFADFAILDPDPTKTVPAIAQSTIITPGCCKQLTTEGLCEILKECK